MQHFLIKALEGNRLATDLIKHQIREFVHRETKFDSNFYEPARGHIFWSCKKSPVKTCIYDSLEDPVHDSCIFCHEPEERK